MLVGVPAVAIGIGFGVLFALSDRGAVDLAAPAGIILSEYAGRRVRVIRLTLFCKPGKRSATGTDHHGAG